MRIFVASSNPGKLRDFNWAAAQLRRDPARAIRLEPLPNLNEIAAPAEDEPTFEGNARIKALFYGQQAARLDPYLRGQLVLADDSGLSVDALDGAPGVRSARFADDAGFHLNPGGSADARNNALLLEKLRHASSSSSHTAHYRCALALARAGSSPEIVAEAEGTLTGEILDQPCGLGGFGYDPLFFVPEVQQTMAEIEPGLRLQLSHRGRALRNLLNQMAP